MAASEYAQYPVYVTLCLCTAISCIIWATIHRGERLAQEKKLRCQPPRSYAHVPFLLGLDFAFFMGVNIYQGTFAQSVRGLFQKYGTTHVARLGYRTMVNTIDPENLEAMMKTNFDDYTIIPGRERLINVLFGKGVFSTSGEDWKQSRLLVHRGMARLEIEPAVLEDHVQDVLSQLREDCLDNVVTQDFRESAFSYTMNSAKALILGMPGKGSSTDQFAADFALLGQMARVLTLMISQIPYLADLVYGRPFREAQKRVFAEVDDIVQHVDYATSEEYRKETVLINGMAKGSPDKVRVRGEALNLLLAGHDTIGIALSELFYCLARKPVVWAKLRAEVASICPAKSLPTTSTLKQMTYLTYVIKEAVRLRPTLSVHGRRAVRDTTLPRGGGPAGDVPILVPKGTYVVYSNYCLYRNPNVFGIDVDEFRPERWASINPKQYEYLWFGAGPRRCPGKEMGYTMLAYITARLAQEVESLEPRDERPWQEARAFSFFNKHGVQIAMKLEG